jgi:UDP-N-acetylmuramoyl-tripeptide--D-alanyl-D-alanine ligase
MNATALGQIAAIVGGVLHNADPTTEVRGSVEYDSRQVTPGCLFAAFAGEHADGHDFVNAALEAGAVASVVSRPVAGPHILVDDVLAAITALATEVSPRLAATVVGVTGSSGKTSTKDLIADVLRTAGATIAPAGSMNNELGFPCIVLRADESTRFLVLELGARGVGHIAHLTSIARPQVGVVLNVGTAHLGEFGSREAIAAAKGELVDALPESGVAILNADDQLVRAMRSRTRARVVMFGESTDADVRALDVDTDDVGRASFTVVAGEQRASVGLRLVGEHHVSNALAAAAVGLECGVALPAIAAALSAATPASPWRMEVRDRADGVTVINDAYNANPDSMRAALKALATVQRARRAAGGRGYAVLGPMAELGPTSQIEHLDLGRLAVRLDIARLIAVGEDARPIHHGATLEGSWSGEASWVPDIDAALAMLRAELGPHDVVLVKASRAASLERLALAILQDGSTAHSMTADEQDEGDGAA